MSVLTPRFHAESTTVTTVDGSGMSLIHKSILSSRCLVPNHITCVLDGLSRSRLAFIQSLMSAMATERRTTAAAASMAGVVTYTDCHPLEC